MKSRYSILLSLMSVIVVLCACCKDDDEDQETAVDKPVVSIGHPEDITTSSFSIEVTVESDGGGAVTDRGICYAFDPYPDLNDEKLASGSGTGDVEISVSGLLANTLYYVRAYATNEKGTAYSSGEYTVMTSLGTVTDVEGNVYGTVKIGEQVWMRENLKSTKYADGTDISGVYPAGGSEGNVADFGRLYDWYAVMHGAPSSTSNPSMVQGVCPEGFHVPSDAEWIELEIFLGMPELEATSEGYRGDVAGKLKVRWLWSPTPGLSDNTSGFSALPAGFREVNGSYLFAEYFWGAYHIATESQDTSTTASRLLTGDMNGIWRYSDTKNYGMSVRCVKDE
jgi:uncharacterized protein (TIGR02145 family)